MQRLSIEAKLAWLIVVLWAVLLLVGGREVRAQELDFTGTTLEGRHVPLPIMRDTPPHLDWPVSEVPCSESALRGAVQTADDAMTLRLEDGCAEIALTSTLGVSRSNIAIDGNGAVLTYAVSGTPPAGGWSHTALDLRGTGIVVTGFTLSHPLPGFVRAWNSAIEWPNCEDCWIYGNRFERWGNSAIDVKAGARGTIHSNDFSGQDYRMRCVVPITSQGVAPDGRTTVTFPNNSECRTWDDGRWSLEKTVWLPNDGVFLFEILGTSGGITLALHDAEQDRPLTRPVTSTHLSQLNGWGIAKLYCSGTTLDLQATNNSFDRTRVAWITQSGCPQFTAFGNYARCAPDAHCDRFAFTHGGGMRDQPVGMRGGELHLIERNDADSSYVPYAEAAQGLGIGPGWTMINNRGRRQGAKTHALGDGRRGGSIDLERNDQEGNESVGHNIVQNFLVGVNGGPIDSCDGDDNRSCSPGEMPQLVDMLWHSQILESDMSGVLDPNNPTSTHKRIGHLSHSRQGVSEQWGKRTDYVITLAYARELAADPNFRPPWWCDEAVEFRNIPVKYDNRTPLAPMWRKDKLPAQIRLEGGKCTLPQRSTQ